MLKLVDLGLSFCWVFPFYERRIDRRRTLAEQSTLTRADLCEAVHEEVGLSRQECSSMVERTLDLIVESLERGETVKLSGFGVFQVREKRARMGRNPKTGEPAAINPRRVISFRASQIMKSRVHDAAVEA
jgi:integration host factor subunit alpha